MQKPTQSNVQMAVRRKSPFRGKQVIVRLQPHELEAVDIWIDRQEFRVTRPEAIRCMINAAMKNESKRDANTKRTKPK